MWQNNLSRMPSAQLHGITIKINCDKINLFVSFSLHLYPPKLGKVALMKNTLFLLPYFMLKDFILEKFNLFPKFQLFAQLFHKWLTKKRKKGETMRKFLWVKNMAFVLLLRSLTTVRPCSEINVSNHLGGKKIIQHSIVILQMVANCSQMIIVEKNLKSKFVILSRIYLLMKHISRGYKTTM